MSLSPARFVLVVLGLAAALAPLWVLESFHLFQLTMAVIMSLAVLGLNIVTGYNGQISLGHGAFFAIGAYVTSILMVQADWSFYATLPFAAAICGMVGYAVGLPALRLGGLYLALVTFSLAVAVPQLLKHKALEAWTGGVQGLFLMKPDPPRWLTSVLPLNADQFMYLNVLIVSGICFLLAWNPSGLQERTELRFGSDQFTDCYQCLLNFIQRVALFRYSIQCSSVSFCGLLQCHIIADSLKTLRSSSDYLPWTNSF